MRRDKRKSTRQQTIQKELTLLPRKNFVAFLSFLSADDPNGGLFEAPGLLNSVDHNFLVPVHPIKETVGLDLDSAQKQSIMA